MSTTVTKALKKEIVKNHLEGLDEDQNLKKVEKKGQVDKQAVETVINEFGQESEKAGLDVVAKSIGVSRLASDLGEVARFKRKNGVELDDMMRGAKVAKVLKNYGVGIPELETFISTAYSRASEKGYTPQALVSQITSINDLERKYGAKYDELKTQYEKMGIEIKSKQNERNAISDEIADLKKRKDLALQKFEVEERNIAEYMEMRQKLLTLGFDVEKLGQVKEFLHATKLMKLEPKDVVSKLSSIGDLENEIAKLDQEMNVTNEELRWKKALLSEVRQLEETNLSIEQVENIRKLVQKISSEKGMEPSRAYAQFEDDIVANYNPNLGLKANLVKLEDEEKRLLKQVEEQRQQLESNENEHTEKVKKIEEKYSKISSEIKAYNDLKEMGLDASKILSWHNIMQQSQLDFSAVETQLKNYASLKNLEKEVNQKIVDLMNEAGGIKETITTLNKEKSKIESSIQAISQGAISQVDSAGSKILSSLASTNQKLESSLTQIVDQGEKKMAEVQALSTSGVEKLALDSRESMERTLSELNSSVASFSTLLSKTLEEASPQLKQVSIAIEAGQKLGQYRNVLPLVDLMNDGTVSETEALIAMWNVTNRFSAWVSEHYSGSKLEISDPLSKLVTSINEEIQKINAKSSS